MTPLQIIHKYDTKYGELILELLAYYKVDGLVELSDKQINDWVFNVKKLKE